MTRRAQVLALATSITLGAAGLIAPGSAHASGGGSADCQPERLAVPEGTQDSWVSTGSPDGTVLAGYAYDGTTDELIVWRDGTPETLDVDLRNPSVAAVNDDGVVAGFGFNAENERVSFLHEDGELTWLGAPKEGVDGTVTDINADGDAVGYGVGENLALYWDADSPEEPKSLPTRGGGTAHGISDDGTVVGSVGAPDTGTSAYVWHPDGSHEVLPGIGDRQLNLAEHISGPHVAGISDVNSEEGSHVRWDLEDNSLTELPDGLYRIHDVNASGALTGSTDDDHATIVRGTQVERLPQAGGEHATAYTLSDTGNAAGVAEFADGSTHAVGWRGC